MKFSTFSDAGQAYALAEWTLARLVNRIDVWGAYLPVVRRIEGKPKVWTAPPKSQRGRVHLTIERLARHYSAEHPEQIVGLHSTSPANTSKWLGLDLDNHDPATDQHDANSTAVELIVKRLVADGFAPLIENSDGRGGYHIWVLFEEPAPTAQVHAYATLLLREHGIRGETFPRQAALPAGKFGNWLRLPGTGRAR